MYALAKRVISFILLLALAASAVVPVWAKQENRFVEEANAWLEDDAVRAQFLLDQEYDSVEVTVVQGDSSEQIEYTDEEKISIRLAERPLSDTVFIQLKAYQAKALVQSALFRIGTKIEETDESSETEAIVLEKEKWKKRIEANAETVPLQLVTENAVEKQSVLEKQAKAYYKRYYGETDPEKISKKTDFKEKAAAKGADASFELEPNDTMAKADWSFIGKDAYGRIIKSGDIDYWKVKVPDHGTLRVWLGEMPKGQNYDLIVYDAEGGELGKSENSGGADELVEIAVERNTWYYMLVKGHSEDSDKKNYYRLKIAYQPNESETKPDSNEPNNKLEDATRLEPGSVQEASIHAVDDVDYYQFDVNLASTIEVSLKDIPAGMDLDLYLLNKDQKQLARSENAQNKDEQLAYNGDPGTYYIKVVANKQSVIINNQYKLAVDVHTMPVILIPGISGSRLSVAEDGKVSEAWLDAWGMVLDNMTAIHRRVLPLKPTAPGSEKVVQKEPGVKIFPEEADEGFRAIEFLSYNPVIKRVAEQYYSMAEHLQKVGYKKGTTLFAFAYDWRFSNSDNAVHLKKKIDDALTVSKAKQVQIVAHSMGGLLTKETMLEYPSYQTKTKRIIYLGTPFLGAPRAYQAIKVGYDYDIPMLSEETVRQISEYSPSAYELLPSKEYVKKEPYLYSYDGETLKPYSYDAIYKDKKLSLSYTPLVKLSEKKHAKWDTKAIQVPQFVIVGQGKVTLFGYYYHDLYRKYLPLFDKGLGDGTVPLVSADYTGKNITKKYYVNETHSSLMRNAHVIQQVAHLLHGIEEVQPELKPTPMKKSDFNYYVLFREDGELPAVTLTHNGTQIDLSDKEKTANALAPEFDGLQVEYHGNVIVVHLPNNGHRTKMKVNESDMLRSQNSKTIVQYFSSDIKRSGKLNKDEYWLNGDHFEKIDS